jgi:hypothetical protein
MSRDTWDGDADGEAGRFVPLYVLVNGRTSPRNAGLDLATQVIATAAAVPMEPEYDTIVRRCWSWISIAELAAFANYPLAVTKLLVDVLLERGVLTVGMQAVETVADRGVLETILARLESL